MTKGELIKSIFKPVIEWLVKKILPWLLSILAALSTVFFSIKNKLVEHPYVLLVSLAIMTATTFLFLILWIRIYWQYERFKLAFGVLWDKNYNMRCTNCKKPLKNSTQGPSIFYCPDKKKCGDLKYVLRDDNGKEMTKQEAIDCLKIQKKAKKRIKKIIKNR